MRILPNSLNNNTHSINQVIPLLRYLGGHNTVQLGVSRKMIGKGKNDIPVKEQSFTFAGVGYIGELVRGNVELLGKNLPVSGGLVEHVNVV